MRTRPFILNKHKFKIGVHAADLLETLEITPPVGRYFTQSGLGSSCDKITCYLMGKLPFRELNQFESTGDLDVLDGLAYDYDQS